MGRILNLTELERQSLLLVLGEYKARTLGDEVQIKLPLNVLYNLIQKLKKLTEEEK